MTTHKGAGPRGRPAGGQREPVTPAQVREWFLEARDKRNLPTIEQCQPIADWINNYVGLNRISFLGNLIVNLGPLIINPGDTKAVAEKIAAADQPLRQAEELLCKASTLARAGTSGRDGPPLPFEKLQRAIDAYLKLRPPRPEGGRRTERGPVDRIIADWAAKHVEEALRAAGRTRVSRTHSGSPLVIVTARILEAFTGKTITPGAVVHLLREHS